MVAVKRCSEHGLRFLVWAAFIRHCVEVHHLNRAMLWKRAVQIADRDCVLVQSDQGGEFLMVQDGLGL